MAKLQIFVLVVALSQVYGTITITTLPGVIAPETRPEIVPETGLVPDIPELVSLPCVSTVRALLEAILERLPAVEVPRPLPVAPVDPTEPELESEDLPETPAVESPCSACFEHINSLLVTAEKAVAVRRMAQYLRM